MNAMEAAALYQVPARVRCFALDQVRLLFLGCVLFALLPSRARARLQPSFSFLQRPPTAQSCPGDAFGSELAQTCRRRLTLPQLSRSRNPATSPSSTRSFSQANASAPAPYAGWAPNWPPRRLRPPRPDHPSAKALQRRIPTTSPPSTDTRITRTITTSTTARSYYPG